MSNDTAIVIQQSGDLITFDDSQVGLIKRTIAKDATDDELALFLHQAKRTGLDPLAKQIYFQKYNTKNGPQIAIITGIDGYRLVADRTGKYAGSDEPVFEGKQDYQGISVPAKATVKVWKIVAGQRVPFAASVYWSEYCPSPPKDYQWKKMPHVMLAKCAEAAALRKAFPADLSGVYTSDEMQQSGSWVDISTGEIMDATPLESPRTAVRDESTTPTPESGAEGKNGGNGNALNEYEQRVTTSSSPATFFQAAVDWIGFQTVEDAKKALKAIGYSALDKMADGRVRQLRELHTATLEAEQAPLLDVPETADTTYEE